MIEIFSAQKLEVASLPGEDDFLICVRGEKGTVLFITELAKYLKGRGRGLANAKLLKSHEKTPRRSQP